MLIAFWALVGWCGTPWPRRWHWPPPPPPPDPWLTKAINVIGGIAGGWAYTRAWATTGQMSGVDVAASAVGALIGATVLGDLAGLAKMGKSSRV